MKSIGVLIFKHGGDCSNGGLSSKHEEALLVWDRANGEALPDTDQPMVELVTRSVFGKAYHFAKPVALNTWAVMFGGCFIYTSDSRFPLDYPLPLHDRVE